MSERQATDPPPNAVEPGPLDDDDLALLAAAGLSERDVTPIQRKVLARMSTRSKRRLRWMVDNWPGRITFRLVTGLRRVQIFDRAMTIAAQTFTSVFPIIIMFASLLGGRNATRSIGGTDLPPSAEDVLHDVVSSGGFSSFGVVGVIVVLISATSLSRALTRAYDAVWRHGRTRLPAKAAWRWLAAVMALALSLMVSHRLVDAAGEMRPPSFWRSVAIFAVPTFIASFVPWILLAARVRVRFLLPGAVLYGLVVLISHPVSQAYLSAAIESSARKFGPIGVAFTYLTYLYCVSWALLATAVLGRVITIDPGLVGRLIRHGAAVDSEPPSVEEP